MKHTSFLSRSSLRLTFAVIVFLAASSHVSLAQLPADPIPPYVPDRVIVQFSHTRAAEIRLAPANELPAFLENYNAVGVVPVIRPYRGKSRAAKAHGLDRLYIVEFPTGSDVPYLVAQLEQLRGVEFAHPDYLGQGGGAPIRGDDSGFGDQYSLQNTGQLGGTIDADMDVAEAWNIAVGRHETVIAVLDSGIDSGHPDFRGRLLPGGWDYWNADMDPEDDHDHGTATTGVLLANANNQFAISGINWNAKVIPIKLLSSTNGGSTSTLIAGIEHTAEAGVNVSNMSLINYPNTPALAAAVATAYDAGVIQIGCNGNSGSIFPIYPASYPEVLATGWTNRFDERYVDSDVTSTLDVVAPGASIATLQRGNASDFWWYWWGCSFATPNAAGVASVLHGIDPTITHDQVADILRDTAEDLVGDPLEDTPGRDDYMGWGRINMDAALASLGLVSVDEIHVDDIILEARNAGTEMRVTVPVSDDLTGAEAGVTVSGTLTLPDLSSVPFNMVTGANGVAFSDYLPGGALPAGAFTYAVTGLTKTGFTYDPTRNHRSSRTHDPLLQGMHANSIKIFDTGTTVVIDIEVVDDDGYPEPGAVVRGTLTTPTSGPTVYLASSVEAAAGVARIEASYVVVDGLYTFQLTAIQKIGFIYEPAKNVQSMATHTGYGGAGDADSDSVIDSTDNCVTTSNVSQTDTDLDLVGDACDVCPGLYDPAQKDQDGDGTGDRCDCAPYNAARTGILGALNVGFDDSSTLRWNGVVGADRYDISSGSLSSVGLTEYGACLQENHASTSLTVSDPAPGDAVFYVVWPDDAICGQGPGGDATAGPRTNANPSACS